jgi:hypothetical protein
MTVQVPDTTAHVQRLVSVIKMASVLRPILRKSNVLFLRFLWAKGLNTKDIHKEMFPVFGDKSKFFYTVGFDALVKRWDKCINVGGGLSLVILHHIIQT